jgi:hypothetical protein
MITDRKMLKKLTQVEVLYDGEPPWPMAYYTKYRLCGASLDQPFNELLPRPAFNKWFYGLFFRLALPFNLQLQDHRNIITSPLTLTVIFHLIGRLRTLGYPSHWMSENLSLILENKVVSTCRPPRSSPSSITDVERNHPMKQLSTTPFVYEMRTLARIYEPILPFSVASETIPSEDEIYNYTFYLRNHDIDQFNTATSAYLALILWNHHLILDIGDAAIEHLHHNIRPLLDSSWGDEVDRDFKGPKYDTLRDKGIIVWSTVTWDVKKKEAKAWMPKTFVDMLIRKKFVCELYRTDVWISVGMFPTPVSVAVKRGAKWTELSTSVRPAD